MKEVQNLTKYLPMRAMLSRILFMAIFLVALHLLSFVYLAIVLAQTVYVLFNEKPYPGLLTTTTWLNNYIYNIVQFLCFNTETKPYPFKN